MVGRECGGLVELELVASGEKFGRGPKQDLHASHEAQTLALLQAHLAKKVFGSALMRAQLTVYKRAGVDPILWPRNAGSWPGYVVTGDPVQLPAGHFGLGHWQRRRRCFRETYFRRASSDMLVILGQFPSSIHEVYCRSTFMLIPSTSSQLLSNRAGRPNRNRSIELYGASL